MELNFFEREIILMRIISREDLKSKSRNKPLWRITSDDVENYNGPCILEDGSNDWEYIILDEKWEKMANEVDCSLMTIEDIHANPWKVIERRYNGEIKVYEKYVY